MLETRKLVKCKKIKDCIERKLFMINKSAILVIFYG